MHRSWAALLLLACAAGHAQQQVVKPPIAVYWMSVETAAGMGLPGIDGLMAGMMGPRAASGRRLVLQLGSQRPAEGAPRADHFIPAAMNMGASLPLVTPARPRPEPEERETGLPEGMEEPKGRMLVYWGCGEAVRPGQPVVIDFARVARGEKPAGLVSRRVAAGSPPAPGRSRTYGDWPNPQDQKPVPANASLRGEHQVRGNYSPDIRFVLGEGHDFMDRVELAVAPRGAGAAQVRWNAVGTATGYFATAMGAAEGKGGEEVVFWSSSEVQEMGSMLMSYVPPGEVARLIREKVVLAPSVTECTVPAEVLKRAGGAMMLHFIAYGPEANFAHPPRPQDPKQPWEPLWAVKARFKSTASTLLGEESAASERRAGRPREERAAEPAREERAAEPARKPAAPDPVKEGIEVLRGIFRR
jgi:hypothetical protein